MNKTTKWIIGIVVVSLGLLFAGKVALPSVIKRWQKHTSDAKATKGKITIAVDDWVGYFPLRSQRLKRAMLNEGYLVECVPVPDYKTRIDGLSKGTVDLAVCTVDAFTLNGSSLGYPGYMVAVIDESKGGDAIVAYTNDFGSLDALRANVIKKIAYTPDSPSHHLLKVAGVDFNIPLFTSRVSTLKVPAKDSADAYSKLEKHEVSAAVLWEPQVSKAQKELKGVVTLLGSDKTAHVIVDVLLANRQTMNSRPEVILLLLQNYFLVLKQYMDEPTKLEQELADELKVDKASATSMIRGVAWASLTDNARQWFGVPSATASGGRPERVLAETIDSVVRVLIQVGDFDKNPLPDGNPLMLTKSDFIEELFATASRNGLIGSGEASSNPNGIFEALTDEQWGRMRDIGTLKVEPVKFQNGTDEITLEGKQVVDAIAEKMARYPNFRIGIRGHSDVKGDPDANKELSLARAQSVARYLEVTHSIDQNRMHAEGLGGTKPLPKLAGESDRAYSYRLPRVDIVLLNEAF